jgi:hypothetical protein
MNKCVNKSMGSTKTWLLIENSCKLINNIEKVIGRYYSMEGPNYRLREENNE